MKPNEIDALIKSKLQEDIDLYDREISENKPFVWASIRHKIKRSNVISWRHLAAAMILFLIGLSIIFYSSQRKRQLNLDLLTTKINQLEKTNHSGTVALRTSEAQITQLENELRVVTTELTKLSKETKLEEPEEPMVLYKTDTIFIKQNEPDKTVPEILANTKNESYANRVFQNPTLVVKSTEVKIDEVIYPDYSNQKFKPPAETSKVKFGTFTARKD